MAQAQDIIHFRPLGIREKLEAYANRHNLSLSDAIRQLVAIGLGGSPAKTASQRASVDVERVIKQATAKVLPGTLKQLDAEIRRGFKNGK